ncbi:MAG: multicopper oxidase domain-containing protein [Casimicrobiaceae bacterium]
MSVKNNRSLLGPALQGASAALGALIACAAYAAVPGITGGATAPTFNLSAAAMRSNQPNGKSVYSWGYGCVGAPAGFAPAAIQPPVANCPAAQMPGPTLIVNEGDLVTVVLTNSLPAAAGNTSILFPGFQVCAGTLTVTAANPAGTCAPSTTDGVAGLLTQEAVSGATVTYQFVATSPGTHSYYSGTQGDLQVEMGLFGAIVVLPTKVPTGACTGAANLAAEAKWNEKDFRLASAAYDNKETCYDREYLFQFSEMDDNIHTQVEQQVLADQAKTTPCKSSNGCIVVATEPYVPGYFMVNGRSMPDDMDPNYLSQYPNQPYNGNPHMHPGELTLVRIIGQGRWQHPFHEHANHVRVLARDGNLLLSDATAAAKLAGPLMFTTTTTPGMTMDGIFYWTGKGLNWDVFGHGYAGDKTPCVPDANGYYTMLADGKTTAATEPNYYEWCGDHDKALEKNPAGQVASGGPVTLPDPNIVTNGNWYGGSPYLGGEATSRAVGVTPIPPAGTVANSPTLEAGYAYMWHSHNEREITTDNVFPGGMMMMMLVDPRSFVIDETN